VGYARVSIEQQDLTAQRNRLAALGVSDDRIYVDHGLTGTNGDRPGLRLALAACHSGDTLVVTKLDRLARSLSDARDILDELTRRNVRLSLGGSIHDPTDPIGRLLFNVLPMVAELEADRRTCTRSAARGRRGVGRHLPCRGVALQTRSKSVGSAGRRPPVPGRRRRPDRSASRHGSYHIGVVDDQLADAGLRGGRWRSRCPRRRAEEECPCSLRLGSVVDLGLDEGVAIEHVAVPAAFGQYDSGPVIAVTTAESAPRTPRRIVCHSGAARRVGQA
jgi:hypothetical protein